MAGWVKIHRKLLDWEWYDDTNVVRLFLHLLLTVNYETKRWHGIEINPGQKITSLANLSSETGLSVMQIRTSMERLKSTNEITSQSTNNYTLITIPNWEKYQESNKPDNNPITNEQQTDNKRITTTKEEKKERREEKKESIVYAREFDEFWDIYPRKDGSKQKAREIFTNYLRKGITNDTIINGLRAYAAACKRDGTEKRYIAHATTWLNGRRWESDYSEPAGSRKGKGDLAAEYIAKGLREYNEGNPF